MCPCRGRKPALDKRYGAGQVALDRRWEPKIALAMIFGSSGRRPGRVPVLAPTLIEKLPTAQTKSIGP